MDLLIDSVTPTLAHHDAHDLILLKVGACSVLFCFAVIGGLLPVMLKSQKFLISVLTVFAGGVILAAGFVHLLGDANNIFAEAAHDHGEESTHVKGMFFRGLRHGEPDAFPYAMFYAAIGFLVPLFLDALFSAFAGIWLQPHHSHGTQTAVNAYTDVPYGGDLAAIPTAPPPPSTSHHLATRVRKLMPSLLFLVALTVHAILEAISVGVQADRAKLFAIAGAIMCHKALEAMALGSATFEAVGRRLTAYYVSVVVFFAALTPIGVIIGIILADNLDESSLGVVYALAAGTFIYVGSVEVLSKELGEGGNGGHSHGVPLPPQEEPAIALTAGVSASNYSATSPAGGAKDIPEVDHEEPSPVLEAIKTMTKVVACLVGYLAMSALQLWE